MFRGWTAPETPTKKGFPTASADDGVIIDCFVLGSRTYEHALQLGWPYGDTPTVVITNQRAAVHQEER